MVDKAVELAKKRVHLEVDTLEEEFRRFTERYHIPKKESEEMFYRIFKMGMMIEGYRSVFNNMKLIERIKSLKKDEMTKF